MRLPPLGAFRFFDIAAKTQNFVKAAEQLNVTHGAVSRQIRLLEESLGVALFERRNRAVFLTAAGRSLQMSTASIFEQLEETVYRLRQQTHENVLVLSCEPTIAMNWLIPRLPAFQHAHPDIQLHISAAGGPIDFQKMGVDLALRRNDFKWGDEVYATVICDEWIGPVCTPESALPNKNVLLHTESRLSAWKTWERLTNTAVGARRRIQYEHFYLCIQAAIAGLGVSMSSFFMVHDELKRGHLTAPYGFVKDGSSYCLLSSRPLEENPRGLRLTQWIINEMRKCIGHIPKHSR